MNNYQEKLLNFLKNSPTCFQAVEEAKKILMASGFDELTESKEWNLKNGGKYFLTKNQSSIMAFSLPNEIENLQFMITASHTDSPSFKLKPNPILVQNGEKMLNVENYGGMIYHSWFDKPLSIAGRTIIQNGNQIESKLVNIQKDLLIIPDVAIHMNREINNGYKWNPQVDLLPLFSMAEGALDVNDILSKELVVDKKNILSSELYLYNRTNPTILGAEEEFIASPRLDNLECMYTTLEGFIGSTPIHHINVWVAFDNEEIGSNTKQGADSSWFRDSLEKICIFYQKGKDISSILARSFVISADNAHAVHPNHPEKSDPTNKVFMNKGIVIKYNGNQKYTTDAVSSGIFKYILNSHNIPFQEYTNRSDIAGGSTLGSINATHMGIPSIDIGLAQLSMHSCYETAGTKDIEYMILGMKSFYDSFLICHSDGMYEIK